MELPLVLVASSMVGVAPQAEGLALPVEVAMTAPRQEQPDAAMVVSEGVAESALPAAQGTAPDAGRMEEDTAKGSPTLMSQA